MRHMQQIKNIAMVNMNIKKKPAILHQGESQSSGTYATSFSVNHNFASLTNQKHIKQKETKQPYKNAAPI